MGRRRAQVVLLAVALATAGACSRPPEQARDAVVVGAGSTTEQRVLGAVAVQALRDAGVAVRLRADLGGTVELRGAALRGTVDVFWDYTGAAWALGQGQQAPPADPTESFVRVRRADRPRDLRWLRPTRANATLALFVRADVGPRRPTLRWLAGRLEDGRRLCADPAFVVRPGGLEALASAYRIDPRRLVVREAGEDAAIADVRARRCYAGLGTATSGVARRAGLVPVVDDLTVFPAFIVAPVVRGATMNTTPRVVTALEPVARSLDTATLARLSARVEAGLEPAAVAESFLRR